MSIPKKLHYIWFASNTNPKGPFVMDGKNYLETDAYIESVNAGLYDQRVHGGPRVDKAVYNHFHLVKKVTEVYDDWEINFWVNDKTLIAETVTMLESLGVKVRELSEAIEGSDLSEDTIDYVTNFNFEHNAGSVIDFSKYLVLNKYGGLCIDINFVVENKIPDEALVKYQAVVPGEENFFFAFEPGMLSGIIEKFVPSKIQEYSIKQDQSGNIHDNQYFGMFGEFISELRGNWPFPHSDVSFPKVKQGAYRNIHFMEELEETLYLGTDLTELGWMKSNFDTVEDSEVAGSSVIEHDGI